MRLTSADWSSAADRSGQDGPAGFQDVAAIREPQRQLHVLLDEHDADALLVPGTRRMSPPIVCTTMGARPRKGSSIISRRGRAMSPRAMATICCWPARQRVRELSPPLGDDGKQALHQSQCLVATGAGGGVVGAEHHVVEHREEGNSRRRSSTCARPSPAVRWAGRPSMRVPPKVMRPARGVMSPEMVFISVDLPAPFGPSTATISPSPRAWPPPTAPGSRRRRRRDPPPSAVASAAEAGCRDPSGAVTGYTPGRGRPRRPAGPASPRRGRRRRSSRRGRGPRAAPGDGGDDPHVVLDHEVA